MKPTKPQTVGVSVVEPMGLEGTETMSHDAAARSNEMDADFINAGTKE